MLDSRSAANIMAKAYPERRSAARKRAAQTDPFGGAFSQEVIHDTEPPDVVRAFLTALAKGPVMVASDLRKSFEKYENLRILIAAGRIRFHDEFFVKDAGARPSL